MEDLFGPFSQDRRAETVVFFICILGFGLTLSLLPAAVVNSCIVIGVVGFVHQIAVTSLGAERVTLPWPLSYVPSWCWLAGPVAGVSGYYVFTNEATLTQGVVFLALLFVCFYFWYILPVAWLHHRQPASQNIPERATTPVSILVPAYNEEGYIGPCIDSLVAAEYAGPKEIIVVDDGSTDATYQEACAHATENVQVLQQENGGKHAALNTGLEQATGEAIITVDADSRITTSALREIVADLHAEPSRGAVAGTVKLDRVDTIVEKFQALEYAVGINTFRRAFAATGAVNVVPGCLGCFRREAIDEVGGYDGDTMTEDFDITFQLLKAGWTVGASDALVYTEAPRTWRGLTDQRLRWKHGNLETILKHKDLLCRSHRSSFLSLVFPYQLVSLFAMPIVTLVILWTVIGGVVAGHGEYIGSIIILFATLELLGTLFALASDEESLWLSAYSPLVMVVYRHFIVAITLKALYDVFRQTDRVWVSPRSGSGAGTESRGTQTDGSVSVSGVKESND